MYIQDVIVTNSVHDIINSYYYCNIISYIVIFSSYNIGYHFY